MRPKTAYPNNCNSQIIQTFYSANLKNKGKKCFLDLESTKLLINLEISISRKARMEEFDLFMVAKDSKKVFTSIMKKK